MLKSPNFPFISIIIPVYNAEKTLNRCLDSLLYQAYPHLEIFCIDDASQDSSLSILKSYQKKNSHLYVVEQLINQGTSCAKNKGLELAKGDYVLFVDSDDFLPKGSLDALVEVQNKYPNSLVMGKALIFSNQFFYQDSFYDNQDFLCYPQPLAMDNILNNIAHLNTSPWARLYSLKIIRQKDLKFVKNINLLEDHLFFFMYLCAGLVPSYLFLKSICLYLSTIYKPLRTKSHKSKKE